MSFIDDFIIFLATPIRNACPQAAAGAPCIPQSTLIIIGAAIALALLTNSANRFLVDYKMVANSRKEYMAWTKAVNKARKERDDKTLDKLMKKQSAMVKMSSRASLEQMKTTLITFVPLLLLYYSLASVFGGTIVAYSPVAVPLATIETTGVFSSGIAVFSLVYWYFLSSFAISIPLSRLFGVQTYSLTGTTQ